MRPGGLWRNRPVWVASQGVTLGHVWVPSLPLFHSLLHRVSSQPCVCPKLSYEASRREGAGFSGRGWQALPSPALPCL